MFVDTREWVYLKEVEFMQTFQERVKESTVLPSILSNVSQIGDPSMAFIFFFPLIFGLNKSKGLKFLITFIISEWLNMVLKWMLQGDRPYWWIKENGHDLQLHETFLTCETGPGVPSGHSQSSYLIWYSVLDTLLEQKPSNVVFLLVFLPLQVLMMSARIFISAHFPHQCLLGFLVAALCIQFVYKDDRILAGDTRTKLCVSVMLPTTAMVAYGGLLVSGFDPNWSIALATKWCLKSSWIYLDTTPFYAMVRYTASAAALAVAAQPRFLSANSTMLRILTGLACGFFCSKLHKVIPRSNLFVFYGAEFVLNSCNVLLIILLPYTIKLVCGNRKAK